MLFIARRRSALAGVLLAAITCIDLAARQATPTSLSIDWDRSFGKDDVWSEFRAMTAVGNDELWVAVSQRNSLERAVASSSRLFLWRINAAGELITEIEIKGAPTGKATNTAGVRDVVSIDGQELLLLVNFEGGKPSVVRVNRNGSQTSQPLATPNRTLTLSKIVPAAGGTFLLLGHESLDALAIKIDARGAVLWEKKQDRGRMELLIDGVSTPDQGFVLVGNTGNYDASRSGLSNVWVGKYDAGGELKAEIVFPGRFGSLARAGDQGYVVAYDRSGTSNQEFHAKGLSADLKELWDESLLSAVRNFSDLRIVALPAGGFAVAGRKLADPFVTLIDAKGRPVTTLDVKQAERSVDIGDTGLAAVSPASLFLASSHIEVRTKTDVRQTVRVRRLSMK